MQIYKRRGCAKIFNEMWSNWITLKSLRLIVREGVIMREILYNAPW